LHIDVAFTAGKTGGILIGADKVVNTLVVAHAVPTIRYETDPFHRVAEEALATIFICAAIVTNITTIVATRLMHVAVGVVTIGKGVVIIILAIVAAEGAFGGWTYAHSSHTDKIRIAIIGRRASTAATTRVDREL